MSKPPKPYSSGVKNASFTRLESIIAGFIQYDGADIGELESACILQCLFAFLQLHLQYGSKLLDS